MVDLLIARVIEGGGKKKKHLRKMRLLFLLSNLFQLMLGKYKGLLLAGVTPVWLFGSISALLMFGVLILVSILIPSALIRKR